MLFRSAGSDAYLTKPFTREALLEAIQAQRSARPAGAPGMDAADAGRAA